MVTPEYVVNLRAREKRPARHTKSRSDRLLSPLFNYVGIAAWVRKIGLLLLRLVDNVYLSMWWYLAKPNGHICHTPSVSWLRNHIDDYYDVRVPRIPALAGAAGRPLLSALLAGVFYGLLGGAPVHHLHPFPHSYSRSRNLVILYHTGVFRPKTEVRPVVLGYPNPTQWALFDCCFTRLLPYPGTKRPLMSVFTSSRRLTNLEA